ncbi:MAG: hypothetical protein VX641_01960 [Planctomycetota bacterium]|nr:hypothetical protein [Planctomycetota bacterium]
MARPSSHRNGASPWPARTPGNSDWKVRLRRRRGKNLAPWIGSVFGHVLLLGLILLIGINLIRKDRIPESPVITAEIGQRESTPLLELDVDDRPVTPLVLPPIEMPQAAPPSNSGKLAPGAPGGLDGLGTGLFGSRRGTMGSVAFAGLKADDARRVAFVVDASGSMIATLPVVIDELERSINNLSAAQSYTVVFFQRDQAVGSPPDDRMVPATEENRQRTMQWIRETVVPSGRSNPVRAIEQAMALEPEIIYLLSSNVTGSGRYAMNLSALLQQLDRLNPEDPRTGRRAVRIKCIQFLDPDPMEALKKIAEIHSGETDEGYSGYRFLGRSELGLAPSEQ